LAKVKPNDDGEKRAQWFSLGKQIASFAGGVIVAAFVLGGTRQKIQDVVAWKAKEEPRVEQIDRAVEKMGHQLDTNTKTLAGFEARIKRIEDETSHFDVLETEHRRLTKDVEALKDRRP
jgi:septal ring factor EnvC (AmiA/AmiB activator)